MHPRKANDKIMDRAEETILPTPITKGLWKRVRRLRRCLNGRPGQKSWLNLSRIKSLHNVSLVLEVDLSCRYATGRNVRISGLCMGPLHRGASCETNPEEAELRLRVDRRFRRKALFAAPHLSRDSLLITTVR